MTDPILEPLFKKIPDLTLLKMADPIWNPYFKKPDLTLLNATFLLLYKMLTEFSCA